MPDLKKTRAELKLLFVENAVPTAEDFAALIDAGLNQVDDGVVAGADTLAVNTITANTITARTADADLALSGNGTGIVQVVDAMTVAGAVSATTTTWSGIKGAYAPARRGN